MHVSKRLAEATGDDESKFEANVEEYPFPDWDELETEAVAQDE